jgi:hypothetical protein
VFDRLTGAPQTISEELDRCGRKPSPQVTSPHGVFARSSGHDERKRGRGEQIRKATASTPLLRPEADAREVPSSTEPFARKYAEPCVIEVGNDRGGIEDDFVARGSSSPADLTVAGEVLAAKTLYGFEYRAGDAEVARWNFRSQAAARHRIPPRIFGEMDRSVPQTGKAADRTAHNATAGIMMGEQALQPVGFSNAIRIREDEHLAGGDCGAPIARLMWQQTMR